MFELAQLGQSGASTAHTGACYRKLIIILAVALMAHGGALGGIRQTWNLGDDFSLGSAVKSTVVLSDDVALIT